jgi:thiol-disulfide isomerase/thioredoxin
MMRKGNLTLFIVLSILVLASAACAGQSGSTYPATPINPENQQGLLAPDFEITVYQGAGVLGGEKVMFSEVLAQGHPVVLNFWAGLCPPCRAEMPDLQRFYDESKDDVLLLGIDVGQFTGLGNKEDAQTLLRELDITYPAGYTNDASIMRKYEVLGMPTTVFIDSNGEIFRNWTGVLNRDTLKQIASEMLEAEARPIPGQ